MGIFSQARSQVKQEILSSLHINPFPLWSVSLQGSASNYSLKKQWKGGEKIPPGHIGLRGHRRISKNCLLWQNYLFSLLFESFSCTWHLRCFLFPVVRDCRQVPSQGRWLLGGCVYEDSGQQLETSSSRDLRHFKDTVWKRALARGDPRGPPPTGRGGGVFLCQASGQRWRGVGPSCCFLSHLGWPHSEESDAHLRVFTAPLSWTNIQQHWVKPEILTLSADEKCTSRWVYIPWIELINDEVSFYRVNGAGIWEIFMDLFTFFLDASYYSNVGDIMTLPYAI